MGGPDRQRGQLLSGRAAGFLVLGQPKAPADEIFMQPKGRRPAEDSLLRLWGCITAASSCSPPLFSTLNLCSANRILNPTAQTHTHELHTPKTQVGEETWGKKEGRRGDTDPRKIGIQKQTYRHTDTGTNTHRHPEMALDVIQIFPRICTPSCTPPGCWASVRQGVPA